jgi:hypothetical protein
MTIAGMKRYLEVSGAENEPGLHGSYFMMLMDRKVRRPRLEGANLGANHNGVRRRRRISGQNHPLLSWRGKPYIASQQPGAANCTGA